VKQELGSSGTLVDTIAERIQSLRGIRMLRGGVTARSMAGMRYLVGKDATGHSMTNLTGRRRAMVAFFLSGVFPGLGQFYNRQPLKGGAFLVAGVALSWLIGRVVPTDLMALASGSVGTDAMLLLCLLLAVWLWSAIDAWRVGR
jgi:hypothetical protein